jgi:hypothetical protein
MNPKAAMSPVRLADGVAVARPGPLYLMWQGLPRETLATMCHDASEAYAQRFGRRPAVLLVAPDTPDPLPDGAERSAKVRPGNVWAGEVVT